MPTFALVIHIFMPTFEAKIHIFFQNGIISIVIGIDVGRLVGLMQADGELLGITNQTDGMACNLQVFYFNQ